MATDLVAVPDNSLLKIVAGLRPLLLLIGVAAAVAAGLGVVLWAKGPTYNMLYANLSAEDTAQVTQALSTAGIAYRLENGSGAVSVAAERINDARLLLAGQGLPESGGGFASMSKDGGFGVSQFMEGARYQHALETELARTIASLQQVEGARVHIAESRQSSFIRDRHPGSASVFVQVKPGLRLASEQVTAIVNLVASSVPELDAALVTVVDQQGRLLSSPQGRGESAARDQQIEFARQLEQSYGQRIEELLTPLVGAGRVRAQVSAQFDMSATEEAREQYRPDSGIVRSEQTSEELSRNGANGGASGIPGSLSNQPPERGVAQAPGTNPSVTAAVGASAAAATPPAGAVTQPDSTNKQATRNFEIDRTVAYTRNPGGRLKRITVAVLVDNPRITGKDGKVTEQPMPAPQLERITALVKDAIGFDATRGDSVNVLNAPWHGEPLITDAPLLSVPIWQQPLVLEIAKVVAGLVLALILVFMVLRPTLRSLIAPMKLPAPVLATPGSPGGSLTTSGAGSEAAAAAGSTLAYEQQIAQARTLVSQDAGRVAQVVKTWVADGE